MSTPNSVYRSRFIGNRSMRMNCSRFGRCMVMGTTAAVLMLGALAHQGLRAQQPGRYDHYEVHDPDLLPAQEYAMRRNQVLARLDSAGAMLVRSADVRNRSNDVDYEYRQRNSMLYLSGVTEEGSALLLVPRGVMVNGVRAREILFVQERNAKREVWTGIRMGPEAARKVTGIAAVLPYARLGAYLDSILPSLKTLYYDGWKRSEGDDPLAVAAGMTDTDAKARLQGRFAKLTVERAGDIVDEMRLVKSAAEIALLKRAAEISVTAHRETVRSARPGMHEYELEAVMEYQFRKYGSEQPGYPSIVGSGPNTCILHYETNRRATQEGDLVLMDCGAEYHGYSADVTRTFPVSGTFTPEQRTIYDLVLQAQKAGIDACRPGNNFGAPHRVAVDIIGAGLVKLGIIKSPEEYRKYFMHGTSHYLGLDVHDVGRMGTLKPGMVLTVEPGIYIAAGSDCDKKWWNIGIRIEDDIVVTEGEPLNLSGDLERTADEIEELMRNRAEK